MLSEAWAAFFIRSYPKLDRTVAAAFRHDEHQSLQIQRLRRIYAESWPGIGMLAGDGRFAIAAASGLYEAILDDIEKADYDVFSRRAHINALEKLRRLPGIWFKTQTLEEVTVWFDE